MITFLQLGRLGRLGNQLFQIAAVIGMARSYSYDFAFPYWKNYEHHLSPGAFSHSATEDIDVQSYFVNPLPLLPDKFTPVREITVPWGYHPNLSLSDNTNISNSYLQTEKYFSHCTGEIRHYFRLREDKCTALIKKSVNLELLTETRPHCGIHVRLGDYLTNPGYHTAQNVSYYKNAVAQFDHDTLFWVFSDEPAKAAAIMQELNISCQILPRQHYMADFSLMTRMDHFIIANSAFSWWGAWLINKPDKKIVAPQNWFGPEAGISASDIYGEGWMIL